MSTRPYRILVAGSRDWDRPEIIWAALAHEIVGRIPADGEVVIVHGGARGADAIAAEWARTYGATVEEHLADWDLNGRAAGVLRNQLMVNLGADVCLAFIKGHSRGATNCAALAERAGIHVIRYCL